MRTFLQFTILLASTLPIAAQVHDAASVSETAQEERPFGFDSPISKWVMPRKGMRIDRGDGTVQLLPLLDLGLDSDAGLLGWDEQDLVVASSTEWSRIAFPVLAIGSYEFVLVYTAGDTKPSLRFSLPIDDENRATVALGYDDGNGIGVDGFLGKDVRNAGKLARNNWVLEPNKECRLYCKVEWKSKGRVRIQLNVNKQKAIDSTNRRSDFRSSQPVDQHFNSSVPILLSKSESEIRIKRIDFRKIKGHTLMTRPLSEDSNTQTGRFGLKFNGKSSHTLSRNFHYDGTYPITFESWVIPYNKDHGLLFSAGWKDSFGWLRIRPDQGKWSFNAYEMDSGIRQAAISSQEIQWGKLTHVAGVFDMDRLILFVDGERVATSKRFNTFNYAPSGCYFRMGSDMRDKGNHFFSGVIDQFRISKGIRYQQEFEPKRSLASEDSTMLLYKLDEGQGNVIRDRSENGFHSIGKNLEWVPIDP